MVEPLKNAITSQRMAHAYLFHGPRGTGKTTTARLLAKRLLCQKAKNDDAEPCTKCAGCVAAQEGSNADIVEMDAASHRGIDDIRLLREGVSLRPVGGTYRVYIIDEVHMLTKEAFSALLKTLEEPPIHAVFILATTELHKVPATIVSRTQVHRFTRATNEKMRERISWLLKQEEREVESEAIDFIVERSDGCYRDAESLLGQILTAHEEKISRDKLVEFLGLPPRQLIQDFLVALIKGESEPALAAVDEIFGQGYDPEQLLREVILEAREIAVGLAKGEQPALVAKGSQARERLPHIIRALLTALQDLTFVPQPLLAIQLAILTLCDKKGSKPIDRVDTSTERVQKIWPQVIQKMRETNPVAATFLRAIEPMKLENNILTLRAKYPLHKNFFSKREHAALVENILTDIEKGTWQVQCVLLENESKSGQEAKGEALLETVKEVFGDKIRL